MTISLGPMPIRVGINGFGRIGRNVFRILHDRLGVEVVAINDITDAKTLAHLLKYDTVMRGFGESASVKGEVLKIGERNIQILAERDPTNLPWKENDVNVVVESTGAFRSREQLEKHLAAGASKVILTTPPENELDAMVVRGVNDYIIRAEHKLFSNASCTTNCIAPIAKTLNNHFGFEWGIMTTVHAYTNNQSLGDLPHHDLRRARAAAQNIIPTSTGAARAVGKVLPALQGRLDGIALRVPVINGSIVDLVARFQDYVSAKDVNAAMKKVAENDLKGIVEYCEDPIVSSDVIGNPHSAVFDAQATLVLGERSRRVKILAWYDNEWGYSNRVCDLVEKIGRP